MITDDLKRKLHGNLIRIGLPMNSFKIEASIDENSAEYFKVIVYKLLNVPVHAPREYLGYNIVYEETYKSS